MNVESRVSPMRHTGACGWRRNGSSLLAVHARQLLKFLFCWRWEAGVLNALSGWCLFACGHWMVAMKYKRIHFRSIGGLFMGVSPSMLTPLTPWEEATARAHTGNPPVTTG